MTDREQTLDVSPVALAKLSGAISNAMQSARVVRETSIVMTAGLPAGPITDYVVSAAEFENLIEAARAVVDG